MFIETSKNKETGKYEVEIKTSNTSTAYAWVDDDDNNNKWFKFNTTDNMPDTASKIPNFIKSNYFPNAYVLFPVLQGDPSQPETNIIDSSTFSSGGKTYHRDDPSKDFKCPW